MRVPILYLIDLLYFYSGTEKHLYDLVSNIDMNMFKPFVVTFEGSDNMKKDFENIGVPVQIININKIYGKRPFKYMYYLSKFIKKENIKILQTFHTNPDIYGAVLAKLSGIPIVISSRRDMGFNRNNRNIMCYKLLNRFVDKIICVSKAVKDVVLKEEGVPEEKIVIIYNGIEESKLRIDLNPHDIRKKFGFNDEVPIIGMLANFNNPIKGHSYFLEAASKIKKEVPNAEFVLAGTGVLENEIRRKINSLGLENCVHLVGHRRDIDEVLTLMDILVVPSLSEGFSNTVVEGLYMKKPIVATNIGGNTDIIKDGETGLLVPIADSDSIAKKVLILLNNKDLCKKIGNKGHQIVKENFLLKDMVKNTQRLYQELLHKKGVIK